MSFSAQSSQANYFLLPSNELEMSKLQTSRSNKTPKKSNYGSLRQDAQTQQTAKVFLVNHPHRLAPGETLQGISLKYGVPIETIKRANRLWSNDLAFIKDVLIVPIDRDKLAALHITHNEPVHQSTAASDTPDQGEYKNFLNKFDSFINESKLKLQSLETTSNLNTQTRRLTLAKRNDSNNNSLIVETDDYLFNKDHSLFKSNQTGSSSLSSASSSNLSSSNTSHAIQRFSNSNLTSTTACGEANMMPDLLITSPNEYSNYYGSNYNLLSANKSNVSSISRARLAQENLQRLEREKDDLCEL